MTACLVSISTLRELVARGVESRDWPGNAERLLGRAQGDYDFVNEPRADFEAALEAAAADEVPLASLIPDLEDPLWMERFPHLYGWHLYFVLNLLAAARVGEHDTHQADSLVIEGHQIFAGDLEVDGDLTLAKGRLLVCGNLRVAGDLRFTHGELQVCGDLGVGGTWVDGDEFMQKVVVGDLEVSGPLLARGQTLVGGDVRAAEVLVNNPGWVGFLKIAGDLDASRLVRLNGDGDWITEVHGEERLTGEAATDAQAEIDEAFGRFD